MGDKSDKHKIFRRAHETQPAKPESHQESVWLAEESVERAHRGVPPTVHEVHARCLRQIKCHTASFQADKENSDMYVIH